MINETCDEKAEKSASFRVYAKVPEGSTDILDISEFPDNTVWDKPSEDSVSKTSSIRSAVSIQCRGVTDRQTQSYSIYCAMHMLFIYVAR